MDIKMNYEDLKATCEHLGKDRFFNMFDALFKNANLYTMSVDWLKSNEYILKFRGRYADIIVFWE